MYVATLQSFTQATAVVVLQRILSFGGDGLTVRRRSTACPTRRRLGPGTTRPGRGRRVSAPRQEHPEGEPPLDAHPSQRAKEPRHVRPFVDLILRRPNCSLSHRSTSAFKSLHMDE